MQTIMDKYKFRFLDATMRGVIMFVKPGQKQGVGTVGGGLQDNVFQNTRINYEIQFGIYPDKASNY
jgi:hypothetical protein